MAQDIFGRTYDIALINGRKQLTAAGFTLSMNQSASDNDLITRFEAHPPPLPPTEESYRKLRADAYFDALAVEIRDDRITVLGDSVDKVISLLGAAVISGQITSTSDFSELLSKLSVVKASIPKTAIPVDKLRK